MTEIFFLDVKGNPFAPMLNASGQRHRLPQGSPAPRGAGWVHNGRPTTLMFDAWVDMLPTPTCDGLVVYGFPEDHARFPCPNNAAIYNADGSLRCQLVPPPVLARSLPGTTLTPEQIHRMVPDGFWDIGARINEFGEACEWLAPYTMWATIGYGYDTFECRYFDPRTGKFDDEHFSVGRL